MGNGMKTYVKRSEYLNSFVDGERYLARTVFESEELIDIGVLDANGEKVMARKKTDKIGFIRWPEK